MVDWMMGLIWVVRDGRLLNFYSGSAGAQGHRAERGGRCIAKKGGLVDVEGMGLLVRRHIAVDDGI